MNMPVTGFIATRPICFEIDFLCTGILFVEKSFRALSMEFRLRHVAKYLAEGPCIIRSVFLEQITRAYHALPGLEKLTFRRFFPKPNTRGFACMEKDYGRLSVEWHSDSLHGCRFDVFRRLRTERSSANLIQAQRDYFGAHTYERTDMERGTIFHTDWNETGGNVSGTYMLSR